MIFAAKAAVERKAVARGIQIGREAVRAEGRKKELERIRRVLAAAGVPLTPEQERVLSGNE